MPYNLFTFVASPLSSSTPSLSYAASSLVLASDVSRLGGTISQSYLPTCAPLPCPSLASVSILFKDTRRRSTKTCTVIVRYETQRQTFAHIPIIEPSILEPTLKCIWAIPLVTIPIESLTRMSICFLYLRIFTNRAIRACCWALIAFLMACWAAYGITSIFQCYPVGHFWNRFTSTGSCFDSDNFYRSVSPPFILADLLIILLPLPVVWRLKSSNTRKLGLTLLFGIGVLYVPPQSASSSLRLHSSEAYSSL